MSAPDTGTLEGLEVGKIKGRFLVPGYQRGYRWTALEVTRLLDDIRGSTSTYYLQPIVVKALGDDSWELIDGQQRLTTLFLIIRHFKLKGYVPRAEIKYTIAYETRPKSAEYLLNPVEDGARTNIDFFHMHGAWEAIGKWLEKQDDATTAAFEIYSAFTKRVKVIWYEAPDTADSIEIFTRLNIGKIPLTDAELVKALVLSRSQDKHWPERAYSVASEWDAIERDLRNPELWAFVTAKSEEEATHIRLLLDILADQDHGKALRDRERPPFHTFETLRPRIMADPKKFWDRVADLHSLLLGWFEERDSFHKIGYLVACGVRFDEVLDQSTGKSKPEFITSLNTMISTGRQCLNNLKASDVRDLSYDTNYDLIKRALLLMNVEAIRQLTKSSERFSFKAYAERKWSLEHIHAQNSDDLETVEQWTSWLTQHKDALAGLPATLMDGQQRAILESRIDEALPTITREKFQELETELRKAFPSSDAQSAAEEHLIGNLALLEKNDNSTLNNAVFEVKRQTILRLDREGSYIPMCTRNVFLKYYTTERAQQLHFWSPQDRVSYLTAIEEKIAPYLTPEAAP